MSITSAILDAIRNGDMTPLDVTTTRGNERTYILDNRTGEIVATYPESNTRRDAYVITAYDDVCHHRALAVFDGRCFSDGTWSTHFSMYSDVSDEPDSVDYDGTWRGERTDYFYEDDHDGYDFSDMDAIMRDYFRDFGGDCFSDMSIERYDPSKWASDGIGMWRCCA